MVIAMACPVRLADRSDCNARAGGARRETLVIARESVRGPAISVERVASPAGRSRSMPSRVAAVAPLLHAWFDGPCGGVAPVAPQLVSSCVLARTNALSKKVAISVRGAPSCLFSSLRDEVPVETAHREPPDLLNPRFPELASFSIVRALPPTTFGEAAGGHRSTSDAAGRAPR
jgi:hypothetical protein